MGGGGGEQTLKLYWSAAVHISCDCYHRPLAETPLLIWIVISAFTSSVKGRTLAALTAALFLVTMVGQGFAIVPVEHSAKYCRMHTMEGMQHVPEQAEHKCKHE